MCTFNVTFFNKYHHDKYHHNHALEAALPQVHVSSRLTRLTVSVPWYGTMQFGRLFAPACVQLWNSLSEPCFAGDGVGAF